MSDGWAVLAAAIDEARAAIAAEAPDPAIAAEGEAYVARMVAAALAPAVLGHHLQADGLARPLPVHGGPNPDYRMSHAPILADRRYRLTGNLEGSERVGVGLYAIAGGATIPRSYRAFDAGTADSGGDFMLEIGPDTGPAGLRTSADVCVLLIRVLHCDPNAPPARLALSGGDAPAGPALMTGSVGGALGFVANGVRTNTAEYLRWTRAARDLRNRLAPPPPDLAASVEADPDTRYFLGGFDLADGEWLEVTMPQPLAGYWSLHAYNYWYESLETPGVHDRNARVDRDGGIRIAIAPNPPPGAVNVIDTGGQKRSAFVCRIIGRDGSPEAQLRSRPALRWI